MTACSFTGPRPKKLYGYNLQGERYNKLSMYLEEILIDLIENKGVDTFISGGALGFDTIAFLTVNKIKQQKYPYIKNILAIPFMNQDLTWNDKDRRYYYAMKQVADEIIYVDETQGYAKSDVKVGKFDSYKMTLRNKYMVDNSQYLVALWANYTEGGTLNCYNYAIKKKRTIIEINPDIF